MLANLFESNRRWASEVVDEDPDFFRRQSKGQKPSYLWIGCSDSRVPSAQLLGLMPGDLFVHRNIANLVTSSDLSSLAAMEFAIGVLKVRHVIVCGHYRCGGVQAVLEGGVHGPIGEWLVPIDEIRERHAADLDLLDSHARLNLLCELNVVYQVLNASASAPVRNAWNQGRELLVHGWMYDVGSGLVSDLKSTIAGAAEAVEKTRSVMADRIAIQTNDSRQRASKEKVEL